MTIVAPEIAERARPGQFLQVGMPADRSFLLRRPFAIYKASRQGGWAGTLEFAFGPGGAGTDWLRTVRAHQFLDIIGPLGRGFATPKNRNVCLLIGEGYASGQMYFLAEELRAKGKKVDMIIGGPTQEAIFKPIEGKRLAASVTVVTEDGSLGSRGTIVDVLAAMAGQTGAEVIYAAGTTPMLRAVAEYCGQQRIPAQVAIEEAMACGWGQCFTCVVPVLRKDGSGIDHQRSCTDGPVFNSSRIAWDALVPSATATSTGSGSGSGSEGAGA
ncbi:MAG: dihydroorotate dehydrogenase electron transfer subunit [Actinomycetota bacterium]